MILCVKVNGLLWVHVGMLSGYRRDVHPPGTFLDLVFCKVMPENMGRPSLRAQYPLSKECTLKGIRVPNMIEAIFPK